LKKSNGRNRYPYDLREKQTEQMKTSQDPILKPACSKSKLSETEELDSPSPPGSKGQVGKLEDITFSTKASKLSNFFS